MRNNTRPERAGKWLDADTVYRACERHELQKSSIHSNSDFNYADARNASKYYAEGEWILSLDTDEYLLKEQLPELVSTVRSAPISVGGILVTLFSHIQDGEKFHRDAQASVRLFRNDRRIVWQSQIHEIVFFSIQQAGYLIKDSTITIYHRGYECKRDGLIGKLERNKEGLMREILTTKNPVIKDHANEYLRRTVLHIDSIIKQANNL